MHTLVTADPAIRHPSGIHPGTVHITIDGATLTMTPTEAVNVVADLGSQLDTPDTSPLRDTITTAVGWMRYATSDLAAARRFMDDLWTMSEVATTPPPPLVLVGTGPADDLN